MDSNILRTIFQAFGAIESVRVLSNKNCGFINFDHHEDAVRARKALQNKEILGPGTGAVRIGFAKVLPADEADETPAGDQVTLPTNVTPAPTTDTTQWTAMMNTMLSGQTPVNQPTLYTAIAAERHHIMQLLGCEPSENVKGT
jgi:hypothetical protein